MQVIFPDNIVSRTVDALVDSSGSAVDNNSGHPAVGLGSSISTVLFTLLDPPHVGPLILTWLAAPESVGGGKLLRAVERDGVGVLLDTPTVHRCDEVPGAQHCARG
jgi:hypothetical protein